MEKLVSIITPCYNMGSYIGRFLDSVLAQTYSPLELIIVNDVSTDNSEEIIKSYFPQLAEKNIRFQYILKENNEGLGAAINSGLSVFNGDFLIWPDSDDFMSPTLIEKMVAFLDKNQDYGLVRTNVNCFKEKNDVLNWVGTRVSLNCEERFKEDLFDITILEKNGAWLVPGAYMIRTDVFEKANPEKHIYPCRLGQNWQMLLPVMYISKCGYIDEPLHNYLIRENSMERSVKSIEEVLARCDVHEDILLNTVLTIKGIDVNLYTVIIKNKYHKKRLNISYNYRNKKLIKKYFEICNKNGIIDKRDRVLYYFYRYIPCANFLLRLYNKTKRIKKAIYSIVKTKKLKMVFLLLALLFFILGCSFTNVKDTLLLYSLALTGVFLYVDIVPVIKNKLNRIFTKFFTPDISQNTFNELILAGTKKRLLATYVADNNINIQGNFIEKIKHIVSKKNKVYEYGEHGFLMFFSLQYAKKNEDGTFYELIRKKFDKVFFDRNDNVISIKRTDQSIYGCVATFLYEETQEKKYKQMADDIFAMLDELDRKFGLICYRNNGQQHIDLLGFVCPFLFEYGRVFGSYRAKELNAKLIKDYMAYGVDEITGVPSQGYNLLTKTKIGYNNWGRGMSWYALALSFANKEFLDDNCINKINLFANTLHCLIDEFGIITQFPGSSNNQDMSAYLPCLYFLYKEKKINLKQLDFIQQISVYIKKDGIVGYNSPGIQYTGNTSDAFLAHDLSQGICLYLVSEIRN
jgi:glycosyltransferase involved in cell wall biosynthesis